MACKMKDISRNDIIRLVALGIVVLLEGLAVLSLIFKFQFFSLGGIYANVVSVAVFVLPLRGWRALAPADRRDLPGDAALPDHLGDLPRLLRRSLQH